MMHHIRRLYDWMIRAAESPRATRVLAFVSFVESSVFPVPPDAMLVPMCLARPARALFYALITTLASVAGGAFGYAIGAFFFDAIGSPVLAMYGYTDRFQDFAAAYNEQGLWIVFAAGLTPLPYKVFTIASGLTHMNFALFLAASIVSRGARFFLEALLLRHFGPPIRGFIERRMGLVLAAATALLVAGFLLVKYAF